MCSKATITASVTLTLLALQSTATAQLWLDPLQGIAVDQRDAIDQLRDGRLLTIDGLPPPKSAATTARHGRRRERSTTGPRRGSNPGLQRVVHDEGRHAAGGLYGRLHGEVGLGQCEERSRQDSRLDVWAIRSLDEGKTWIDRQKILDGYCGA